MKELNDITQIIKLWKELKVEELQFEFSCGGDSMNDTNIVIIGESGNTIQNDVLEDYFENNVYDNVEFYEASDGHYQGESGVVHIGLNDDGETFYYNKSSESEWCESVTNETTITLDEETKKFILDKVTNINGNLDEVIINYKDCILNDREEELADELETKISDVLSEYQPDSYEGELQEWYNFTTNEVGDNIKFEENNLVVSISNETTIWKDDDN